MNDVVEERELCAAAAAAKLEATWDATDLRKPGKLAAVFVKDFIFDPGISPHPLRSSLLSPFSLSLSLSLSLSFLLLFGSS